MSIPKEKTILLKIKEIVNTDQLPDVALNKIKELTDSYEDPGYIGGPVVGTSLYDGAILGEAETEEK